MSKPHPTRDPEAYAAFSGLMLSRTIGALDASSTAQMDKMFPGSEGFELDMYQRAELLVAKVQGVLTPEEIATAERNLPAGWVWKTVDDHMKALTDWVQLDPTNRLGKVPDKSVIHDGLAVGLFVAASAGAAREAVK